MHVSFAPFAFDIEPDFPLDCPLDEPLLISGLLSGETPCMVPDYALSESVSRVLLHPYWVERNSSSYRRAKAFYSRGLKLGKKLLYSPAGSRLKHEGRRALELLQGNHLYYGVYGQILKHADT